ncbi:PEP-CTERM sorting domain-containing protein [Crocosphaera sp. UHCC 0190]|uniref:PEP-CTERM sorting domain-containing protein n=1 Tax=Crocosphaera sp. UHCC 0190 TaxID=3110246 RepID=UPI002B2106FD|nr:PEP-CTERM sorting domain-containing protein [Crocosphaera sp. UHCC 0190]MEA5509248.1 PEP-CTERM sorting domain-containing protein [Crocosphaera sp. UHCC 0190]
MDAKLYMNLYIPANVQTETFSFDFSHFETPNNGVPCAAGGVQPCPDLVSFLNNGASEQTINIGGDDYNLVITGFLSNGTVVSDFLTLEGVANSAILQGKLVSTSMQPVPEPLTILGASAAVGFGGLFKRKLAQKKNTKA